MICMITAAGCSNGNNAASSETTTTAASEGSKQTVALSDDDDESAGVKDTTEEALTFLDGAAPLFGNYMRRRRTMPLTFETEVTVQGMTWNTKLYIEDEDTCAMYSEDPSGIATKVIYDDKKGYQIDYNNKQVYEQELSNAELRIQVDMQRLATLDYNEISASSYSTDTEEYEGTEYDCVTITEPNSGASGKHYFDKSTGKLVFSVSGDYVTKVIKFENSIDDKSVFEVPSDFTKKTYENLVEEQNAANAE